MQLFDEIKYARSMKRASESWKPYFLVFSVLLLVLTVVGDRYRSPLEPEDHKPDHSHDHSHSHDHDEPSKPSKTLDEAFSQAPDPKSIPADPEKEHRMAIFHYNEGNKFLTQGDWEKAVGNYIMALHHDPELNAVYINMSNAYLKGQQYEEAKKTLDSFKMKAPENPHLHYNLACYYSLTHQETASLEALQKSIHLGYKNPDDAQSDPDLANLRQTTEFQQWVKTL